MSLNMSESPKMGPNGPSAEHETRPVLVNALFHCSRVLGD